MKLIPNEVVEGLLRYLLTRPMVEIENAVHALRSLEEVPVPTPAPTPAPEPKKEAEDGKS